jgi:hypothetical protein
MVRVRRPDANELREIRAGALSYEALVEQAEALGARIDGLVSQSLLPPEPDQVHLNALCADIVARVHARERHT